MEICWSLARVSLPSVPAPPFEIEAATIQQKSNDATVNPIGSSSDQQAIADTYWSQPGPTPLCPGWPFSPERARGRRFVCHRGQTFTEDWLTRPCCEQYERPICPKRTSLKRLRRNGQRWRNGPSKSGDSPGASYASSCCFWSVMNISGRCHRGIRSVLRTALHCASAARF